MTYDTASFLNSLPAATVNNIVEIGLELLIGAT